MKKAFVYRVSSETDIFGNKNFIRNIVAKFPTVSLAEEWICEQKEDIYDFYIRMIEGDRDNATSKNGF